MSDMEQIESDLTAAIEDFRQRKPTLTQVERLKLATLLANLKAFKEAASRMTPQKAFTPYRGQDCPSQ